MSRADIENIVCTCATLMESVERLYRFETEIKEENIKYRKEKEN